MVFANFIHSFFFIGQCCPARGEKVMKINKVLCVAVIVGVGIGVAGCKTAEQKVMESGSKPMTQAELQKEHSRDRMVEWSSTNGSGTASYMADGTASVSWGSGSDTGKWWIADGKFCQKWMQARGGSENCYTTYRIGENRYERFSAEGSMNSRFAFTN